MYFRFLFGIVALLFSEGFEGRRLVVFASAKRTGNRIFDDVIVTMLP